MMRLILLMIIILLSHSVFAQQDVVLRLTQQCDEGNASSCAQLGDLYHQRSIQEHIILCDQGELEYCKMLGRLYVYGSGVEQNYEIAFKYFLKGCAKQKNTNNYCDSHKMENPSNISADLKRIKDHWQKLCDDGDSLSCIRLGLSHQYGYGFIQNTNTAFNYFLEHCGKPETISCTQLGDAYNNRGVNIFEVQLYFHYRKDANLFYEKACQQNDPKGCYQLATSYPDAKLSKNLVLYQKSCRLGYGYACLVLGGAYLGNHHSDLNVKANVSKSKQYFKQACDAKIVANCSGTLFGPEAWGGNIHQSDYFELMRVLCYEEGIQGFCNYVWNQDSDI